ncbi:uncharacterized protein BDW43DRAFT_301902 [Aspergillus alliaceus]|uniref:uncharacterized protein n=1 Tax=Petromyces alliaceus TaxID=209559 RepID=UPI0012A6D366|nr:uncharacterized protein BDW43DRAFT_301902 [Aspergillus alliaceus]KAB8231243.1 hypothetical protein BDW43DRAFT_301902 [Aspergillus alliaceus]
MVSSPASPPRQRGKSQTSSWLKLKLVNLNNHLTHLKRRQAKAMTLDLSLPSTCPALCVYGDYSWDAASFALYTLIDLSPEDLERLLSILNKEWLENNPTPIVRTPKTHNLAGKRLKDAVQAQVDLDKEITPVSGGQAKGVMGWYPTAFIVVTTQDWADEGLLFVFMDDTDDDEGNKEDPEVRRMDKFFFEVDDAPLLLSSFSFGDLAFVDAKEQYGVE